MDNEIISDKLSDIGQNATMEVLRLADEAGVDRDELVFSFANTLFKMALNCTFAEFKFE